jgi:hypothetical protein
LLFVPPQLNEKATIGAERNLLRLESAILFDKALLSRLSE